MNHTCHAIRCTTEVPPKMFMCLKHWRMVPKSMQDEVWANYRRGQEVRKDPTENYLDVTKRVRLYVAEREGVELSAVERHMLTSRLTPSSSAPTPEGENRCACGRLDLGKYDGLGSTDPKDVSRGSHSRSQCYDMQQRRLPSSSAPKEPDNANL